MAQYKCLLTVTCFITFSQVSISFDLEHQLYSFSSKAIACNYLVYRLNCDSYHYSQNRPSCLMEYHPHLSFSSLNCTTKQGSLYHPIWYDMDSMYWFTQKPTCILACIRQHTSDGGVPLGPPVLGKKIETHHHQLI